MESNKGAMGEGEVMIKEEKFEKEGGGRGMRKESLVDYSKYYSLDRYLFDEVTKKFEKDEMISAEDFFCIVIWKANRAKSKIAKKIMGVSKKDLMTSVKELINDLVKSTNFKDKLLILVDKWKFGLPMASAILSVLYPQTFSVYDYRVCDTLNNFHNIKNLKRDKMVELYFKFLEEVNRIVPDKVTLREKDHFLWGKSFYKGLENDIKNEFKKL